MPTAIIGAGGLDLQPFFDLITIHELGHAFEALGDLRLPTFWLSEIFVNLALHAFVATQLPASLATLEVLSTVGAGSQKLAARMRAEGTIRPKPWRREGYAPSGDRETFVLGSLLDSAIERRDRGANVFRAGEEIGVRQADGVTAPKPRGVHRDRLGRLVNRDLERRYRLPGSCEPRGIGGWRDQHFGQIHDADRQRILALTPAYEQGSRARVVRV